MTNKYQQDLAAIQQMGGNHFAEMVLGYKWAIHPTTPASIYQELGELVLIQHLDESIDALVAHFDGQMEHDDVFYLVDCLAQRFWGNDKAEADVPNTWGNYLLEEVAHYAQAVAMAAEYHIFNVLFFFAVTFNKETDIFLQDENAILFSTIPGLFAKMRVPADLDLNKPFYVMGAPKLFTQGEGDKLIPSDGTFRVAWWTQDVDIYTAFLDATDALEEHQRLRIWCNSHPSVVDDERTLEFYEKAVKETQK